MAHITVRDIVADIVPKQRSYDKLKEAEDAKDPTKRRSHKRLDKAYSELTALKQRVLGLIGV